MSSQLKDEGDGPFVGLVVGYDEAPSDDSFSTLGLHSIFSEDDLRNASREQQEIQKQRRSAAADADRQTRARKSSSGGMALGKFIQESSSEDDEMDLKALLLKGSKLIENYSRMKNLHGSFTIGEGQTSPRRGQTPPPRFHGNRWLESAGKSVSCRNLGYDSETEHNTGVGSGSRRSNKSGRKSSCEQIVDQAIRLSKRSRSSSPQPPPLMDVSGDSLMDASQKSGLSEAEDAVEASAPSRPMRRCKSIGGGGGGRTTPLMSNRGNENKRVQEATGRALNALVKQNSVTILNPSTPNSRKTMLSIGKSVSSRNLCLEEDSKSSSSPRRPKGMTRKSMSVRNFSAKEMEDFHFNPPLSPGKRPRNARHVGARSKSVRNFSAWEREEPRQLGPMPLSPLKRSSRKNMSDKRETLPAAFNGRKFLSYSRSLSCKDLDSEVETTCTPTTVTTTSTETSPSNQHMTKQSSIRGLHESSRPNTPSTLASNDVLKQSSLRQSNTPQPVIEPTITSTTTTNSNTPPSHNPPLSSSSESRPTTPKITTTRPSTPSPMFQSPTASSMSKSMSSFLKKRVENEKMSAAVEALPTSRRKLLAGGGRSNSARRMEEGRKARLSFGKSLSARNLTEADNAVVGNLSKLPPVPGSPCLPSQLSVWQEESSKNGLDESVTGISLAGNSSKEVDGDVDTPGMDSSMPGLSPIMDSSVPDMDGSTPGMDCSAPGMDSSTPGMDGSTPGMDSSMPGLSPMTPLKTPYACATTRSSQGTTLSVVGEERLTQAVASPPLAHADSDAACASTDSVEDPYQTTTVESESEGESEEACENDAALRPSPELSPIREVGAKSPMASRRSQSHRRLSVQREVKSPLTIRTSIQGSSLQTALKKSVRAASLDRKRSSTKGKSSSLRASSHEVSSKQSHRKAASHESKEERKSSNRRVISHDSKPSQKKTTAHDSKPSQGKTTSHDSKNDRSASYKRTISHDSKGSALRGSSHHDHKPAPAKCKSQDGQRKQKRRSSLDRQSAVAARLSSQPESKPSSLKAALHKSNDKGLPGKKSSSVRRQSTSSRQRRESRSGRKEDRRPSNKLTKRESQKHMSASTPGSSRRRASTGPAEKKVMSQSTHASSSRRRRSSRLQLEKTLSVTIHACEQSQSSISFEISKEMNVSNSSASAAASRTSGSRHSRDRKKKQRSSRKLALQEPLGGSSTSTSEDKKTPKQKRRPSSRASLSKESEVPDSRADSPNCVAEYSPGAKAPPSPAPSKQGQGVKEARKNKRNSLSGGVLSSRRSLKWADRMDVGSEAARLATGGMRMDHYTVGSEAARLATSLHDDDEDSCDNRNQRPSCSDSEDRSHCSWSTAEFSSVAWQE